MPEGTQRAWCKTWPRAGAGCLLCVFFICVFVYLASMPHGANYINYIFLFSVFFSLLMLTLFSGGGPCHAAYGI